MNILPDASDDVLPSIEPTTVVAKQTMISTAATRARTGPQRMALEAYRVMTLERIQRLQEELACTNAPLERTRLRSNIQACKQRLQKREQEALIEEMDSILISFMPKEIQDELMEAMDSDISVSDFQAIFDDYAPAQI